MTRLSRNNRSLFRQTATGLALLLLLFLLPPCAAKHMPDWPKVQALSPGVITRVQLDKNEAPSGARKIKGFLVRLRTHPSHSCLPTAGHAQLKSVWCEQSGSGARSRNDIQDLLSEQPSQ